MKVKEVERSANISWSPAFLKRCYLATATLAQQLDDTFSTSSQLELFSLAPELSGSLDLSVCGKVSLSQKMHRLVWTGFGSGDTAGTIIGSGEEGRIWMLDAGRILSGEEDALLHTSNSHSGAVRTMDVSPIQPNILASGATDSEIYIWDLNSPTKPMSPGGRIQPFEEVTSVSWNVKAAPILGSTFPSGQSVVWDLRKDGPILRVSQPGTRFRPRALVWHPEVPTQMAVGSEEDTYPLIQLWDLRMAKTPMRAFEKHQMGILNLAWCPQDPDLLLSCGKDNQMFLWNPNAASDEGHLVQTSEWCFDAQWCGSHAGLIATASFSSRVSVYSVLGGGPSEEEVQSSQEQLSVQLSDTSDPFAGLGQNQTLSTPSYPPPKAPRWMHVPSRANFGFGGRLVSFVKAQQPRLSQVTTDTDFLIRNAGLEGALRENRCLEFAGERVARGAGQMDEMQWRFLEAAFLQNPRPRFLELLGYTDAGLRERAGQLLRPSLLSPGVDPNELSEKMQALLREKSQSPSSRSSSAQELRNQAPELGGADGASSLFSNNSADFFSSQFQAPDPVQLPANQNQELANLLSEPARPPDGRLPPEIPMGEIAQQLQQFMIQAEDSSPEGLITRAVLLADYDTAVDLCLQQQKLSEALILALAGGKELYQLTLEKFFRRTRDPFSRFLSHVVWKQWGEIASSCTIASWREVLATLITYAPPEEFFQLCAQLGERLTKEGGAPEYTQAALLCYVCSGDLERLSYSLSLTEGDAPDAVVRIVEKVVLLRLSIEQQSRPEEIRSGSPLERVLLDYIQMLTSQGQLHSALLFMERLQLRSPESQLVAYRVRECLGLQQQSSPPFSVQKLTPGRVAQARVQSSQQQGYRPSVPRGTPNDRYAPAAPAGQYPQTPSVSQTIPPAPPHPQYPHMTSQLPPSNIQPVQMTSQLPPSNIQPTQMTSQHPPSNLMTSLPPSNIQPTQMTSQHPPSNLMTSLPPSNIQPTQMTSQHPPSNLMTSLPPSNIQPTQMTSQHSIPPLYQPVPLQLPSVTSQAPSTSKPPQTLQPINPQPAPIMRPSFSQPLPAWNDPPPLGHKSVPVGSVAPITLPAPPVAVTEVHRPVPHAPSRAPDPPPLPDVPQEFRPLLQVFEDLLLRCSQASNNPGQRQKLADIGAKLEQLKDALRFGRLDMGVIGGLQQMAMCIQQRHYEACLPILNSLVASGSFAELGFLTGVKPLINIAKLLHV